MFGFEDPPPTQNQTQKTQIKIGDFQYAVIIAERGAKIPVSAPGLTQQDEDFRDLSLAFLKLMGKLVG